MENNTKAFLLALTAIISIFAFILFSEKLDKPVERCYHPYGGYVDCHEQKALRLAQASAPITYNIIIEDPEDFKSILESGNYHIVFENKS